MLGNLLEFRYGCTSSSDASREEKKQQNKGEKIIFLHLGYLDDD
jgi:hypothetical protein